MPLATLPHIAVHGYFLQPLFANYWDIPTTFTALDYLPRFLLSLYLSIYTVSFKGKCTIVNCCGCPLKIATFCCIEKEMRQKLFVQDIC